MQNTERDLKLYYSISEVAQMFDVNESLLRFWEKEFPQISPKKGSRGVRQYRKEDVETIRLIIIKKDNNREQYNRTKIEKGVLLACHKRPIW